MHHVDLVTVSARICAMLQAPRKAKADPTPPLQCPSPRRLCFLLCCQGGFVVLLLVVFVIPAHSRPTWAQHLELGLILIARSLVRLVHVCLAVTRGRWGGGCRIAALVNGSFAGPVLQPDYTMDGAFTSPTTCGLAAAFLPHFPFWSLVQHRCTHLILFHPKSPLF